MYRPEDVDKRVHSSCYEHLKTNTFRDDTAFSDFPMPSDYPPNPTHRQVIIRFRFLFALISNKDFIVFRKLCRAFCN